MKKTLAILLLSTFSLFGDYTEKAKGTLVINPFEEGVRSYGKIELKNEKNTYVLNSDIFGKAEYSIPLSNKQDVYQVRIFDGEEGNFENYYAKDIQLERGKNPMIVLEKNNSGD